MVDKAKTVLLSEVINIAKTIAELGNTISGDCPRIVATVIQWIYNAADADATIYYLDYNQEKKTISFWDNGKGISSTDKPNLFKINYSEKLDKADQNGKHGTGKCAGMVTGEYVLFQTKHSSYQTGANEFKQSIQIFEKYFDNFVTGDPTLPGHDIKFPELYKSRIPKTGTVVSIPQIYEVHCIDMEELVSYLSKKVDRMNLKKLILNGKPFPVPALPGNAYKVEKNFEGFGGVYFTAFIDKEGQGSVTIGGSSPLYDNLNKFAKECFRKEYRNKVKDIFGCHPNLSIELYLEPLKELRAHSSDKVDEKEAHKINFDEKFMKVLDVIGPELIHYVNSNVDAVSEERAGELAKKLQEQFPLDDEDEKKLSRRVVVKGGKNTITFDSTGVHLLKGQSHVFAISSTGGDIDLEYDAEAGTMEQIEPGKYQFTAGQITESFPIIAKNDVDERTTFVHIVEDTFLGVNKKRVTVSAGTYGKVKAITFANEKLKFESSLDGVVLSPLGHNGDEVEFYVPDTLSGKFKIFVSNERGERAVCDVTISDERSDTLSSGNGESKNVMEDPVNPYPGFKVCSENPDPVKAKATDLKNQLYIIDDMSDATSSSIAELGAGEVQISGDLNLPKVFVNFSNVLLRGKSLSEQIKVLIPYFARIHVEYRLGGSGGKSLTEILRATRESEYNMMLNQIHKQHK